MPGTVDAFSGVGRSAYEPCRWWNQQTVLNARTGKERLDKVCYRLQPAGTFYAEEIQPIAKAMSASGDVRYTRYTVTISTSGFVNGVINQNDLVEYQGRIWRVESINFTPQWSRSQYASRNGDGSKILVLIS